VLLRGGGVAGESRSGRYERPDAATLRRALGEAIAPLGVGAGEAVRVGLCVPGILSDDRRRVVRAVNLPGLEGFDLRAGVEAHVPAVDGLRLTSDALASTYGYWWGERRPGRLLSLVIGTGVGACVLDDGVPLEVVDECPGHLGQMDVGAIGPGDAPVGPDGGRGSLEGYLGAAALTERFGADRVAGLLAAADDDPALVALARAIRIGHAIYRPAEVVLLGGVGTRLAPRRAAIERLARAELTSIARPDWRLAFGASDRSGATGAALLAGA
jgi:predicted NBD/HSP70 family sugar kinase